MQKTFLITLTISLIAFSSKTFSQSKSTSPELKKIASNLMECFYITKASSLTNSTDCTTQLKLRIAGLSSLLQTKVDQNKTLVTQKIGVANFDELKNFVTRCDEYSLSSEELTTEKRSSLMVWISLWKSKIEEIYNKLNR